MPPCRVPDPSGEVRLVIDLGSVVVSMIPRFVILGFSVGVVGEEEGGRWVWRILGEFDVLRCFVMVGDRDRECRGRVVGGEGSGGRYSSVGVVRRM